MRNQLEADQQHALCLFGCLVLATLAVSIFYLNRTKPRRAPINFVILGTNTVPLGTAIFDSHSRQLRGEVIMTDTAYEFPDGTVRPAVLLKAENGAEAWVPRGKLDKMLIPLRSDTE